VLDFEFAGQAPRVMDLAVALHGFAGQPSNTPSYWAIIDAFAHGYGRQVRLTDDELVALPDLMRIRQAISLSLRVERRARAADLANRVDRLLRLDDALTTYGDELSRRVASNAQAG
jgi:Ser/Thr protein kinase RdoA (MazF antagonist)